MSTTYVIIIKCVYYQFETLSETFVDKAYDIFYIDLWSV